MKKFITRLFFILCVVIGNSQQDAIFSQYHYNASSINPAYTGTMFSPEIFLSHKSQWVGLEGAPTYSNFSFQSNGEIRKINWGLNIKNDQIGPTVENNLALNVSYVVPFDDNSFLSFGLKGSMNFMNVDFSILDIYNTVDPLIRTDIDKKFVPNIGFGFHYFSEKAFLGFAIPQVLKTDHFETSSEELRLANERPHYYLTLGYIDKFSENVSVKYSILMKWVKGVKKHSNLSIVTRFYDSVDFGVGYDTYSSWNFLASFKVFENLMIGYTVDAPAIKSISNVPNSHEVFLKWTLDKDKLPKSIFRKFQ